ncbi:hypothetical protein JOF56_010746 [Kibdelosporangium banguiense]|uniref:AAA+ ATPase domain-containing protein n=1 Tax=Kibdelosporangium banguiense TaxID=1365924 RepID=A0ABS4U139_9PSEU|nr:hypothetical protein [Kibdelosporangium banguiense]MBP2330361.1 hypothetical protein [Kibdelosporangium banguiense]
MLWTTSPDWSDATAELLHRTLQGAIWENAVLVDVWRAVGMAPAEVAWNQPASMIWRTLTRDAFDAGKLEKLIFEVRERIPAVAGKLDRVLAARRVDATWYTPLHRHTAMLVGPGCRRALIDRERLRRSMIRMIKEDFPVLAITGGPGTGKSYSRHLIRHLVHNGEFVAVDVENDWYDDVNAAGLLATLATRLGIPRADGPVEHVEQSRAVRELVHSFVGRFRSLPQRQRWIFIDGLDRPWVRPCVHIAVAQLAKEVEAGQLHDTRLIVTGHPGDFSPDVLEVLLVEPLSGITEGHLREFFTDIATAVGCALEPSELDAMVTGVLAQSDLSDLRAVGAAAGKAAHARFAPEATA